MNEIEKLYRTHRSKYLNMLRRVLKTNSLDPEDVFQTALLEALKSYHTYDPAKGRLENWFVKVMFYTLSRMMKKEAKWNEAPILLIFDEYIDYSFILEHECSLTQKIKDITSPVDQKIVILTYMQGYTMENVRDILGVSEGKISGVTNKFKQSLRTN